MTHPRLESGWWVAAGERLALWDRSRRLSQIPGLSQHRSLLQTLVVPLQMQVPEAHSRRLSLRGRFRSRWRPVLLVVVRLARRGICVSMAGGRIGDGVGAGDLSRTSFRSDCWFSRSLREKKARGQCLAGRRVVVVMSLRQRKPEVKSGEQMRRHSDLAPDRRGSTR